MATRFSSLTRHASLRFLKACRRERTDVTPVWFMRQAGRYMPQYRKLRQRHSILDLCHSPELAAEVTLQPVERLGVDAAIVFADILLPFEPLRLGLSFEPGEGPHIDRPIRDAAGVKALQLFDSWVGCLSPDDYRTYVQPHSRQALSLAGESQVPLIHFGTGTATFLEDFAAAGGDVISIDWRIPLDAAWSRIGNRAIQGNLEPAALLAPAAERDRQVSGILKCAAGRPGHIFNLGHGVLPETDVAAVRAVVDLVHGG